jgi:GNAT superfamily N-acetyltransferase
MALTDLAIRPYERKDEASVLALLSASLGSGPAGERPVEFFRWKHLENPFGQSFMLVAETDGRIVGFRAFMRWRFTTGGGAVTAVRAVDTATHPDHRGRGIFSRLTLEALGALRGGVDLVFNTPNEKSLPGYLKMGWRTVGAVPIRVRIRRPVRFARHARSLRRYVVARPAPSPSVAAPHASEALRDAEGLSRLLQTTARNPGRFSTPRTIDYLRWRYGAAPLLDYRAVGESEGLAIFRVRPRGALREATVAEFIVSEGLRERARHLLRAVSAAADVDHITVSFPAGSDVERALRRGTVPAPGGMTLVTNPLSTDIRPDPTELTSWALTLGDLEVF